jgi:hypothetical protein
VESKVILSVRICAGPGVLAPEAWPSASRDPIVRIQSADMAASAHELMGKASHAEL